MCKELSKLSVFSCLLFIAVSCGGNGSSADSRLEGPEGLSCEIDSALNNQHYSYAIELIDTLNSKYPDEIELRKRSMLQRAKAMEGLTRDSIPLADQKIAETRLEIDSLMHFFVAVREKDFPVYWVEKGVRELRDNSVQPRLQDDADRWLLAVKVSGVRDIKGISLHNSRGDFEVFPDNMEERTVKSGDGYESVSLSGHEIEGLVDLLRDESGQNAVLRVEGAKGVANVKLGKDLQNAIIRTSDVARLREENRKALLHRELLERKLIVAQNQIANFSK